MDDRSGRHPVDPSDQTDYGLRAGAAPAEHQNVHWSNANVNENFPRPILTAALFDRQHRLLPLL